MTVAESRRPTFYEGQYLGAEDLTAAVNYGRTHAARHRLGGHTWGIAAGLHLKETAVPGGGGAVDVTIMPGYAHDGYGRPIVLTRPHSVPASLFSSFGQPGGASMLLAMFLRYREIATRGPKPGFEPCGPGDATSRVEETFEIEIGSAAATGQRHTVDVAGRPLEAENALQFFLGANPPLMIPDESVPFQNFPDPEQPPPRWLVAIGVVRWQPRLNAFTPGHFVPANQVGDAETGRDLRRYTGVVASAVQAPDGVIRLKDRAKPPSPTKSPELVWVEGDLRVDADARLFGGKLDLRRRDGLQILGAGPAEVPLTLQRAEDPAAGSVSLQVTIGKATAGKNRLAVGTVDPANPGRLVENFLVKDNGQAALGAKLAPAAPRYARLTLEDAAAPLAVRATNALPDAGGLWRTPLDNGVWRFVTNTAALGDFSTARTVLALTHAGAVGVGTDAPEETLSVMGSLNIDQGNLNDGTLLVSGFTLGSQSGEGIGSKRTAGGNRYGLDLYTAYQPRLSISQGGNVGIGATAPSHPLHVARTDGIRQNRQYLSGRDGWSSLSYNAYHGANNVWSFPDPSRAAVTIEMDDADGDFPRFEVWSTTLANKTAWRQRLAINGDNGNVALAHNGGLVGIGTATPITPLHVSGSKAGDAGNRANHIALLQNTSISDEADVLALQVGFANPDQFNNYITFFAGNTAIGAVEQQGGTLAFNSIGADVAEWLPRRDPGEEIGSGDIVGIAGGGVTRITENADAVAAITSRPVVVGNAPRREDRERFAKVSFIGQVPVKVRGAVRAGDLIVPSGQHDGIGVAVSPDSITAAQAGQIVGQAWESSAETGVKLVGAAVGLPSGAVVARLLRVVETQSDLIEGLRQEVARGRSREEHEA